jgi:DNA-binding transcriptional MerR regulator
VTELDQRHRTLRELAEEVGVPPRTIRFYISRGLLDGPLIAGRRARYGTDHVERLKKIRALQQDGLTLNAIAGVLGAGREEADLPSPTTWNSYQLQEDVVVWIREGSESWRAKHIRLALENFADQLRAIDQGG